MSDETAAVTATIKFGSGYDAPWVVFRANTVTALNDLLRDAYTNLTGPMVATAQVFQGEWSAAAPQAPQAPQQPAYQAPAQAPPAAAPAAAPGGAPNCAHGPMRWNEAKPDSGKSWKGWFCSGPRELTKDQKCPTQWGK